MPACLNSITTKTLIHQALLWQGGGRGDHRLNSDFLKPQLAAALLGACWKPEGGLVTFLIAIRATLLRLLIQPPPQLNTSCVPGHIVWPASVFNTLGVGGMCACVFCFCVFFNFALILGAKRHFIYFFLNNLKMIPTFCHGLPCSWQHTPTFPRWLTHRDQQYVPSLVSTRQAFPSTRPADGISSTPTHWALWVTETPVLGVFLGLQRRDAPCSL